jgi:outer membrane protein assembly factor BamB
VHPTLKRTTLAALAIAFFAPLGRAAEDWPKWMGPRGDNISRETIPDAAWPADGPKKLWSKTLGIGFSSPVAAKGKVYVFSLQDRRSEVLTALDATTGQEVWKQSYVRALAKGGGGLQNPDWDGTRATPTIDGDAIYTFGSTGDLVRRNLADGKLVWQVNVLKETDAAAPQWGTASSPLVDATRVYVQAGIGDRTPVAVAVDKKSGKIAWKSEAKGEASGGQEPSGASYAAIVAGDVAGSQQLFAFGARNVYGMDPADGRTLWTTEWTTDYDVNATTPIYRNGMLLISSEYSTSKGILYTVSDKGVNQVWESPDIKSKYQPPIVEDGYIYVNSRGIITCVEWESGKTMWESKDRNLGLSNGGSIVRLGGSKLLCMSEKGKMSLATATPRGSS